LKLGQSAILNFPLSLRQRRRTNPTSSHHNALFPPVPPTLSVSSYSDVRARHGGPFGGIDAGIVLFLPQ